MATVNPGQSKVSQLHLALAGYQNILWFQVSVHHAVRVKECKTAQQLPHQVLQNTHTGIFELERNTSPEFVFMPLSTPFLSWVSLSFVSHFNAIGG